MVPSATLTVITAVPLARFVTLTVFPDTVAVAIVASPDLTEIAPSPALVTVKLADVVRTVSSVLLSVRLPSAFPIFHVTFFAPEVPSDHL